MLSISIFPSPSQMFGVHSRPRRRALFLTTPRGKRDVANCSSTGLARRSCRCSARIEYAVLEYVRMSTEGERREERVEKDDGRELMNGEAGSLIFLWFAFELPLRLPDCYWGYARTDTFRLFSFIFFSRADLMDCRARSCSECSLLVFWIVSLLRCSLRNCAPRLIRCL